MDILLPLFGIVTAIAIGAASPGPSFLLVARIAVAGGRSRGLAAAAGMGFGGVVFAALALAGLIALLASVDWLYLLLRLAGGAYLLLLAWRIWRGSSHDERPAKHMFAYSILYLFLLFALLLAERGLGWGA